MPSCIRFLIVTATLLVCLKTALSRAQTPAQTPLEKISLASGIDRIAGTEPTSQIQYVRLISYGTILLAPAADGAPRPMLIGQCTLRPNGKYLFELFANFGDVTDLSFYPPWKPVAQQDSFPPRTVKVNGTMEFLGYTKIKPVRRQWEIPAERFGEYRYNPPGAGSSNLEEITFYLRFLLALPTLHLTLDQPAPKTKLEFLTTPLLTEIHREPLCKGALL